MASWDKFLHQKMTLSVTLVDCRLLQKLLAFLSAFFASFFLLFFGFFSYCLVLIGSLFLTPFFHLFLYFLLRYFCSTWAHFFHHSWRNESASWLHIELHSSQLTWRLCDEGQLKNSVCIQDEESFYWFLLCRYRSVRTRSTGGNKWSIFH